MYTLFTIYLFDNGVDPVYIYMASLQVDAYLTPEEMFKGDMVETIPLAKIAESVMSSFHTAFDTEREKLPSMFPEGETVRPWNFQPDIVFSRFTKVHERLKIAYVSSTALLVRARHGCLPYFYLWLGITT